MISTECTTEARSRHQRSGVRAERTNEPLVESCRPLRYGPSAAKRRS